MQEHHQQQIRATYTIQATRSDHFKDIIQRIFLFRTRIIVHEIALFIDHAPSTIDEANIKEVVDIREVIRIPRIIKGRPGRKEGEEVAEYFDI